MKKRRKRARPKSQRQIELQRLKNRIRYREKQGFVFDKQEIFKSLERKQGRTIKKVNPLEYAKQYKDRQGNIWEGRSTVQMFAMIQGQKGKYAEFNQVVLSNVMQLMGQQNPKGTNEVSKKYLEIIKDLKDKGKGGVTTLSAALQEMVQDSTMMFETFQTKYIVDNTTIRSDHLTNARDYWFDNMKEIIKKYI